MHNLPFSIRTVLSVGLPSSSIFNDPLASGIVPSSTVTTDRMSAFDVVLPNAIPGKGEVLTELSEFWFKKTQSIVKNHMTDDLELVDLLDSPDQLEFFKKRSMIVKRLNPLP